MITRFACDAVLFDLDGVLVDSTASIERHWRTWAAKHDLVAEDVLRIAHGRRALETIRLAAPHLSAEAEARDMAREESRNASDTLRMDGAAELLTALPADTWAIVTSAPRATARIRLRNAGLPLPVALVTADDIFRSKPDPEGYLRAAALLAVPPRRCIVIEDAPPGIAAARAADMIVIAVTTTHRAEELAAADARVSSLVDIRITMPRRSAGSLGRIDLAVDVEE